MSEKKMSFEEFSELVDNSDLSLGHMADMLAEEMKKAPKLEPIPVRHIRSDEHWINDQIYRNGIQHVTGVTPRFIRDLLKRSKARIRDLFGYPEGHENDLYAEHGAKSIFIADVLIRDAILHNTRNDLPDELIPEYDRRVCDL